MRSKSIQSTGHTRRDPHTLIRQTRFIRRKDYNQILQWDCLQGNRNTDIFGKIVHINIRGIQTERFSVWKAFWNIRYAGNVLSYTDKFLLVTFRSVIWLQCIVDMTILMVNINSTWLLMDGRTIRFIFLHLFWFSINRWLNLKSA